jgi:hypothetical protein
MYIILIHPKKTLGSDIGDIGLGIVLKKNFNPVYYYVGTVTLHIIVES